VEDTYLPLLAQIERIEPETATEKSFFLRLEEGADFTWAPGQFVEVSVLGTGEAPFCIANYPPRNQLVHITARRYPEGLVSQALHSLEPGDWLGLRGPLGNGFPLQEFVGRDILVVAGGIGLPAVRAALLYLLDHRGDYRNLTLLHGARTPRDRVYKADLKEWEQSPDIVCQQAVDTKDEAETWEGHVGVITTLFEALDVDGLQTTAIIVGPAVMYPFVVTECRQKGIADENMYFSLERHMNCGVGKCGHCAIGDKYVCTDGPVFNYTEIQQMQDQ